MRDEIANFRRKFNDVTRLSIEADMTKGDRRGVTDAILLLHARVAIDTLEALLEMRELIDTIDSRVLRLESKVVDGADYA